MQNLLSSLQQVMQQSSTVNPVLADLFSKAAALCEGKPVTQSISSTPPSTESEVKEEPKKPAAAKRRAKKPKHQEASPSEEVKAEQPTNDPATPVPGGVKLLMQRFAQRSALRLRRRQRALDPILSAKAEPHPEDLQLPQKILQEQADKEVVKKRKRPGKADQKNQVACMLLKEVGWAQLKEKEYMLQTYNIRTLPQKMNIILSCEDGSRSLWVAECEVTACQQLRAMDLNKMLDSASATHWRNKLQEGTQVYKWHFKNVSEGEKDPPMPMKITYQKFRNRHFMMDKQHLEEGIRAEIPKRMSLYSTSRYFLKLLRPVDYQRLKASVENLNGFRLRVGTTCSGTDIGVVAVKAMLAELNREFQA